MMTNKTLFIGMFLLWSVVCGLWTNADAAIPRLINYQGKLTDASRSPLTGSFTMVFRIYNVSTGGAPLWEESLSGILVSDGLFDVILGSQTALTLPFDVPYYLETVIGSEILNPRQTLTSSAYALNADSAQYAKAIKFDSADSSPGYIADKVSLVNFDTSGHTLALKWGGVNKNHLKTAYGELSVTNNCGMNTLPGGEYGFYPQFRTQSGVTVDAGATFIGGNSGSTLTRSTFTTGGGTYASIFLSAYNGTLYVRQRYVTASGQDQWVFLLLDKSSGVIISVYSAPDHPSYGNGGDPDKVPHPFGDYDETTQEIILLDKETVEQLKEESEAAGQSITTLINEEYKPDENTPAKYKPLHSGKFIDEKPEMIKTIPSYIKVRKLIKLTWDEQNLKTKKAKEQNTRRKQGISKKVADRSKAITKLSKLGLTKDEISALVDSGDILNSLPAGLKKEQ